MVSARFLPPCCACDSFDEVESCLNLHLSNIKYAPAVPFCLLRTRQHCQQGFELFFVLASEHNASSPTIDIKVSVILDDTDLFVMLVH